MIRSCEYLSDEIPPTCCVYEARAVSSRSSGENKRGVVIYSIQHDEIITTGHKKKLNNDKKVSVCNTGSVHAEMDALQNLKEEGVTSSTSSFVLLQVKIASGRRVPSDTRDCPICVQRLVQAGFLGIYLLQEVRGVLVWRRYYFPDILPEVQREVVACV